MHCAFNWGWGWVRVAEKNVVSLMSFGVLVRVECHFLKIGGTLDFVVERVRFLASLWAPVAAESGDIPFFEL